MIAQNYNFQFFFKSETPSFKRFQKQNKTNKQEFVFPIITSSLITIFSPENQKWGKKSVLVKKTTEKRD